MFISTGYECGRGKGLSSKKGALREDSFYSLWPRVYMIVLCHKTCCTYVRSCVMKKWNKILRKFLGRKLREKRLQNVGFSGCFVLPIWLFHFLCFTMPRLESWSVHQCFSKEQYTWWSVSEVQETLKSEPRCTLLWKWKCLRVCLKYLVLSLSCKPKRSRIAIC